MIRFYLTALAAVAASASDLAETPTLRLSPRIANGVVASIVHFPYMASLEVAGFGSCGASIIKSDVVLTAAHCTGENPPMILTVRAGTPKLEGTGGPNVMVQKVDRYFNHPGHRGVAFGENDIAVVWLKAPFRLGEFINVIQLAQRDYTGEHAIILGWGKDENFKDSDRLKRGTVKIISNKECARRSLPQHRITKNMVCTETTRAKQTICKNDSGGPLVIREDRNPRNDVLVGITSYGRVVTRFNQKFCDPDAPAVYTRIESLLSWVCTQVQVDSCKHLQ